MLRASAGAPSPGQQLAPPHISASPFGLTLAARRRSTAAALPLRQPGFPFVNVTLTPDTAVPPPGSARVHPPAVVRTAPGHAAGSMADADESADGACSRSAAALMPAAAPSREPSHSGAQNRHRGGLSPPQRAQGAGGLR